VKSGCKQIEESAAPMVFDFPFFAKGYDATGENEVILK